MRLVIWALLALTLHASAANAQDDKSAKAILPHCAAALEPQAQDTIGGRCAGIIATLTFVSRVLPDNLKFCLPSAAPPEQVLQAITAFVEKNPEAQAQDFRLAALAAMRAKWPCQE